MQTISQARHTGHQNRDFRLAVKPVPQATPPELGMPMAIKVLHPLLAAAVEQLCPLDKQRFQSLPQLAKQCSMRASTLNQSVKP